MLFGPDPNDKYPLAGHDKLIFLKHFITAPNIHVGDYTYYDDSRYGPEKFEEYNVLYNYQHTRVKLIIGKFCALAAGTTFIMTGDHKLDAVSTFPFPIFGKGWEYIYDAQNLPLKGDIVVGNDVWFGYNSMIKAGVKIGDGAIIGTNAFVVKDVPAYSIVGGNPAKVIKMRFDDATIKRLQAIAWWDWPAEKITKHLNLICHLDIDALERASKE